MIHIALHFLVPAGLVGLFFRKIWLRAYALLIATLLVDLDHLLANPIYDPGRCSIGFHPLHELWFVALYVVFCFIPKMRLLGIGLTIHMALDSLDCQVTNGVWLTVLQLWSSNGSAV